MTHPVLKWKGKSPDSKREHKVMLEIHIGINGEHFNISKTLNKVRERFNWLRSRLDVED